MVEVLKVVLIIAFVIVCLWVITAGLEKGLISSNIALRNLLTSKEKESEILYKILKQVHHDLSLLKRKDCPEEEFKNIPYEIIHWLEELIEIKENTSCQDSEKDS